MENLLYAKALSVWKDGCCLLSIESVGHYLDAAVTMEYPMQEYTLRIETLNQEGDICLEQGEVPRTRLWDNTDYWVKYKNTDSLHETLPDMLLTRRNAQGGNLNSRNYVGLLDSRYFGVQLPIEFISQKDGYEEDFTYLQTELTEFFYGLLDRGNSFFEQHFEKGETAIPEGQIPYSQLAFLKDLLRPDRLPEWIEYLTCHSEHSFCKELEILCAGEIEELSPEAYLNAMRPDNLYKGSPYPMEVESTKMAISYDTPENRFVKFFLEFLLGFLEELDRKQSERHDSAYHKIELERSNMSRILSECLEHPFWVKIGRLESIPGNSQILQRKYPYHLLFQAYHNWDLKQRLNLHELDSAFAVGQKDAPMLYQYFVFLKLFDYLCMQFRDCSVRADFIKYRQDSLDFTLREGSSDCAVFCLEKNRQLKLYYNKTYHNKCNIYKGRSYSHKLKPDISIELCQMEVLLGILHFDAKYKASDNGRSIEEDINKMHAYKDGIMGSLGAYAICLSKEKMMFVEEEYGMVAAEQMFPSVGAFPLHLKEDTIAQQLQDIFSIVEAFAALPGKDVGNGFAEEGCRPYHALERKMTDV